MISENQLVTILKGEPKAVALELEMFDAIGKTPKEIEEITGRGFDVETLVLPDFEGGGDPILSHLIRFRPQEAS